MRAICESCAKPQPVDWRPGDLCVHCGLAAREECRCFWCAKWGPRAKFCRKCGASAVAQEHYGPARMLKSMGASVFEIPKLLAELDPELIETHQSLYGRHAALVNLHVEDVRWLSQSLYQKHWAEQLEEELVPQLPWTDEQLKEFAAGPRAADTDLAKAKLLAAVSPFSRTKDLANLVRIQMGDFSALRESAHLIHSGDEALAAEAALQLSGWRALYTYYTEISRYDLIAVLKKSPLPAHAAPRLAALGDKPEPAYGVTGDADTDFLIPILDQNVPVLESMLRSADGSRRYVAAMHLIRLGSADGIGEALLAANEDEQLQLLQDIARYKRAFPALHETFFTVFDRAQNSRVSRAAAHAISLGGKQSDALRLLEISGGSFDVVHSLLRAKLTPETLFEIGFRQVKAGQFRMGQWGWDEAAKPERMPLSFVEECYGLADEERRRELLSFAEKQIEAHRLERSGLERFLIRQCFAEAPADTIGTAWASIHRIQMHRQVGLTVPCDLSMENIAWCWSMPEVLVCIARMMAYPEAVKQTFVRDDFDRFLRSAEDEFFVAAVEYPDECQRVIASAPLADPYIYAVRFADKLRKALAV